jgi:ribose/xylose/arabinose/galactoside ABC-type transport system permease subunit
MAVQSTSAPSQDESPAARWLLIARDFGIVGFWILLLIFFGITANRFASPANVLGILNATAVVALLAVAEGLVVMAGLLDLSIVATAALSGIASALAIQSGVPLPLGLVVGLIVGLVCGLINGLLVDRLRISSLVATLGTLTCFTGLALIITDGRPIFGVDAVGVIGTGRILGIPYPIVIMIVVFAICGIVMSQTRYGIRLLAVGGNAEAARRAGVQNRRYVVGAFVACGAIAAIAGIVVLARLGTAQASLGDTLLFDAVTAVALAGVLLTGGRGSILKVLVGALIVSTVANGLVLLRVSSFWTYVTTGILLIVAVWAETALSRAIERARTRGSLSQAEEG